MRTNRPKSRAGFTLVRLLAVLTVIVGLVGLFWPVLQKAARHSPRLNNLKQQALAVTSYLSAFSDLSSFGRSTSTYRPPTGTRLPSPKQNSPYLDHQGLYGQPSTGAGIPWQQNSPYLDHQGL